MASGDAVSSIDQDLSSTKTTDNSNFIKDDPNIQSSSSDINQHRQSRYGNKGDKERKIGHRRVGEGGEITYKKIQTSQIMGSIQLGIQHTVGSLASKPKRDLLMMDFFEIESITFPPEGSSLTPAHHYSEFRYKIYAPIAFRYFRDLFGIQPDDFMMSMCSAPLRELSNPGASGSIFYLTADDEFIIKTVQHKEGEFLQKLLPGYYMNLNQNPRTLLPKFFGLYCLQTSTSKNIRLVVMNNLLPSSVKMHLKYDLKGSTFKRKASKAERSKKSPTYKDLDFMEHHPNGLFLEAETYSALIKTIQRDCTVLESFKIMDYSLLVGVHNLDLASKEKKSESKKLKAPIAEDSDLEDNPDGEGGAAGGSEVREKDSSMGMNRNKSANRQRLVAHSTAMESIQAESEPIDDEDDVPPGGIPARSEKGERLLLYIGIIDILQSYRLKKKLEHTFKSIIHDGDTVSVCRPSFYAQRFQNFMAKTVFRKIPSLDLPEIKGNHRKFRTLVTSYIALKHSPSKRKSLSKAIQRSIENENEIRSECAVEHRPAYPSHTSGTKSHTQSSKPSVGLKSSCIDVPTSTTSPASTTRAVPVVGPRLSIQHAGSGVSKSKVPPPVPPRGSPGRKKSDGHNDVARGVSNTGIYSIASSKKKNSIQTDIVNHYIKSSSPTIVSTFKSVKIRRQKLPKTNKTLEIMEKPLPRFGERRSPSNVQDWLELHDLFDIDLPPPLPPPPKLQTLATNRKPSRPLGTESVNSPTKNRKACHSIAPSDSIKSTCSTARSEVRSRKSYRYNLLHRVDMLQRQNSVMSRSGRPSIGSIVYNFPPIEPDPPEIPFTHSSEIPKSYHRSQQKSNKHRRMFQYADIALRDERFEVEQDENLLQSVNAFVEVRNEIESKFKSRKSRPPPAIPAKKQNQSEKQEVFATQKRNGRDGQSPR